MYILFFFKELLFLTINLECISKCSFSIVNICLAEAGFSVVILKLRPFPLNPIVPLPFIIAESSANASSLDISIYLHISPFTFAENDINYSPN